MARFILVLVDEDPEDVVGKAFNLGSGEPRSGVDVDEIAKIFVVIRGLSVVTPTIPFLWRSRDADP